jgi:hypothetical protein
MEVHGGEANSVECRTTMGDGAMLMRSLVLSMSEHADEEWSGMVSLWPSAMGLQRGVESLIHVIVVNNRQCCNLV